MYVHNSYKTNFFTLFTIFRRKYKKAESKTVDRVIYEKLNKML